MDLKEMIILRNLIRFKEDMENMDIKDLMDKEEVEELLVLMELEKWMDDEVKPRAS